ncbi:hypothetical protein G4B88_026372 [Cannabis sativa]|uniref:Uncharacterized protein n=1 Tax=Cannabis sativa TaxID=3483 RepID=A0A7J6G5S2_CANSA|nr:hypothetical protein G4B88_026372 [Cannabis sativa]
MKKKNYLIGAQWLRTGREEETAMEGGAIGQTSSGGQGVNASKIMEVDGDVSGVNGSVSIPVNESQSINAKISMESVQAGGDKINKEIPYMHATDCLLDTKKRRMEDIMGKRIGLRVAVGLEGAISFDVQGKSGGVALLWRHENEAQLLGYGRDYIDVEIVGDNGHKWRPVYSRGC